jgi:two-component system LytT family response regulator
LKSFTADRLHAALDRALRARNQAIPQPPVADSRVDRLLAQIAANQTRNHRILVRNEDRLFFVRAAEIEWVEAEEKYVLLHTRAQKHIVRQGISALEEQLAPAGFVRIHRAYLLNLEALQELVSLGRGDCIAVLKSGTRLSVGRSFKDRLLVAMGQVPMSG